MFIPNREIHKTFTKEQKEYLLEIAGCMNLELEVSKKQLSPLYGLIYIDSSDLSEKDIKRGQEIWKEISSSNKANMILVSVCCGKIHEDKDTEDVCPKCRELASWKYRNKYS